MDEIVTVSPTDEYNQRFRGGDPLYLLIAAVIHERELIKLAYKEGGKIILQWTPLGPRIDTITTLHKTTRKP